MHDVWQLQNPKGPGSRSGQIVIENVALPPRVLQLGMYGEDLGITVTLWPQKVHKRGVEFPTRRRLHLDSVTAKMKVERMLTVIGGKGERYK
jgi:hypothetical protein